MGNNQNLKKMFAAPDYVRCPLCEKAVPSGLDDYDIETPDTLLGFGRWKLICYCESCDYNWYYYAQTKMTTALWDQEIPLLCDRRCPSMVDNGVGEPSLAKRCSEYREVLMHPCDANGLENMWIRAPGCIAEHGFKDDWRHDR